MAETDVVAVLASALSCTYWPAFPTSGLMRRSKQPLHSITSPARPRGVDEVVFADNALPVTDQVIEQVEYLRRDGNDVRPAMQLAPVGVECVLLEEIAQAANSSGGLRSSGLQYRLQRKE